jgi:hypothetical protein
VRVLNRALVALAATGMASALSMAAASGANAQTAGSASAASFSAASFIGNFNSISTVASTVPVNGDVNPYGTVVVQHSQGLLHRGDVLVSNFNNSANQQGTGSTIVQISPSGAVTQFAQINAASLPGACPGGVGLTTALTVLSGGWVIVGSLPTVAGNSATAQAGCLIVLNSNGQVRETFSGHGINGPWDLTALDAGSVAELFVTNVLNGTVAGGGNIVNGGTVLRLLVVIPSGQPPRLVAATTIGSGFAEETSPSALVVGPTGVGLGANGTLYVADTLNNRIAAIPGAVLRLTSAGTGSTVSEGGALNNELGLTIAPNGDILTVNGGNGNLVEVTPGGRQVAVKALDTTPTPPGEPGNGALFGLAVAPGGTGVYFVDDDTNTLNLLN